MSLWYIPEIAAGLTSPRLPSDLGRGRKAARSQERNRVRQQPSDSRRGLIASSEVASRAQLLERTLGSEQIPRGGNQEGLRAEPKIPASERQLGVQRQVLSFRGKEKSNGTFLLGRRLPWMNPHVPLHLLCESYLPMRCSAPSSCLNGAARIHWYDSQSTL